MSETNTPSQSPKLCRGLFAEIRELMNRARDQAVRQCMTPLDEAPVVVISNYGSQLTVTGMSFTDSLDGRKLLTLTTAPESSFPGDFPKEPEAVTASNIVEPDPNQPLPGETLPES